LIVFLFQSHGYFYLSKQKTVRGTPAVIRSQQLLTSSNPLHPIFNTQCGATSGLLASSAPVSNDAPSGSANGPPDVEGDNAQEGDGADSEDYSGLLNDGLGDEGESDDEGPSENAPGDAPNHSSSRVRRQLPDWLQTQFDEKLKLAGIRENGLPLLYARNKTFWFPVRDPYFALQDIESLSPQKMFQARFFLWDPDVLVGAGIPCPNCRTGLNRLCPIPRPRRCVDLDRNFWIIGYRYLCTNCVHPKSKKKTVTFRSWDPRIIENLPPSLAESFPIRLTYRSGISDSLFMFMRSCFQSGMGA
jgi:hypothetical protein